MSDLQLTSHESLQQRIQQLEADMTKACPQFSPQCFIHCVQPPSETKSQASLDTRIALVATLQFIYLVLTVSGDVLGFVLK